jgi:hypothetical protein
MTKKINNNNKTPPPKNIELDEIPKQFTIDLIILMDHDRYCMITILLLNTRALTCINLAIKYNTYQRSQPCAI